MSQSERWGGETWVQLIVLTIAPVSLLAAASCQPDETDDSSEWKVGASADGTVGDGSGGAGPYCAADGGSASLDLLWVVDNSATMCREQAAFRRQIPTMLNELSLSSLDLHVAVTTTHFEENSPFEKVAEPGKLQSIPHPSAGFTPTCQFDGPDRDGRRDWTPLLEQMRAAVQCAKNPGDFPELRSWSDRTVTDEERRIFRCALFDDPPGPGGSDDSNACESIGMDDSFTKEQLFPCGRKFDTDCDTSQLTQVYRQVDTVLRADDYETSSGFKRRAFRRDLACMSLVGTRGDSTEQGLRAAARAVAPFMTGGPPSDPFQDRTFRDPLKGQEITVDDGATRPNHGFLRRSARTAVLFFSNENDCSHRGDVIANRKRSNSCGSLNCYFPTKEGQGGALIGVDELWQTFKQRLKASKRISRPLAETEIVLGTVVGRSDRYAGPIPNMCSEPQRRQLQGRTEVCATPRSDVRSGDRYARFLERADREGVTVVPSDPDEGLLCRSSLRSPFETLGRSIQRAADKPCP